MKLTTKWGGKNQRFKTWKASQKLPWDLLGIPDPRKQLSQVSIEEIRQQVQVISSRDLSQGVRSRTEEEKSREDTPPHSAKGKRKAKRRNKTN